MTDDNPRNEDPARITADILAGVGSVPVDVMHDRAAAITAAIGRSVGGDVVLVAGKGHEDYQIYGDERRVFSDQTAVRAALEARRANIAAAEHRQ